MKKLVVLLISILFICGCEIDVKPVENITDHEMISLEYSLSDSHPFTYLDSLELETFLEKESGILVIANADDETSQYFIKLFNESLDEFNIGEVYYFDYNNLKDLDEKIKDKLAFDEDYLLMKPEFYIIKKGELINKYNLDSLEVDEIDVFSDDNFKEKIYEFYKNLICDAYSDRCIEKEN